MRATTIPAQITTVEDKIAGNLNITQVILLGVPIIFTAITYTVFPPIFHFSWYKLPLALLVVIICVILSLRIRGKVVINWLFVVMKYNLRPRYFVFNRNDEYLREMCLPIAEVKPKKSFLPAFFRRDKKMINGIPAKNFDIKDLMRLKDFINNPNYTFAFKVNEKGGINVALEQVKR